ncbi:glycosyltransferase 87 family protein [Micromonosporaceae bacterium Da 78-11]
MPTVLGRLRAKPAESFLLIALFALAVLIRWVSRDEFTWDMRTFATWYHQLVAGGRIHAMDQEIGNYNSPFMYLVLLATYLPGPVLLKLKAIFVLFDVLLAFFTYKIVALRWPGTRIPIFAALVMVFLPTVAINASFYGQMDSMWASTALAGVYFLLRDRQWLAVTMCTVAVAFKPQGIFILPILLLAVLAGRLRWYKLIAGPVVFLLLDLPAILLGRDPVELLTLYDPARQAKWVSELSASAPSIWEYFPVSVRINTLKDLGYLVTVALILGLCYAVVARRIELTPEIVVTSAALFVIQMPYTMTGMHERYFYLGDVLSLVVAFYRPRLWFVPLLVQAASLLSYLPFLFGSFKHGPFVPMMVLSTLMGAALLTLWYTLARDILTGTPRPEQTPTPRAEPVESETTAKDQPDPDQTAKLNAPALA